MNYWFVPLLVSFLGKRKLLFFTKLLAVSIILLSLNSSCEKKEEDKDIPSSCVSSGTYTDARDGQTYKIVQIGNQCWFAENLNFATTNSSCYDYLDLYCDLYGKLYSWNDAQIACPDGWHLPSANEWEELFLFVGGFNVAGGKLKSTTSAWKTPNVAASDAYGFSALPSGYRLNLQQFILSNEVALFWTATEYIAGKGRSHGLFFNFEKVTTDDADKNFGYACRCLKD